MNAKSIREVASGAFFVDLCYKRGSTFAYPQNPRPLLRPCPADAMINITHTPEGNLLTYVNGEPVICTRISHMLPRLYSRALTIDFGRQTTSETVHVRRRGELHDIVFARTRRGE